MLVIQPQINIIEFVMDNLISRTLPNEIKVMVINTDLIHKGEYNEIPHLLVPICNDLEKVEGIIHWLNYEMTNRFSILNECGMNDIYQYNSIEENEKLSNVVLIIDEIANIYDINSSMGDDIKENLDMLLSRGSIVGIHTIMSTKYDIKFINIGKASSFINTLNENEFKNVLDSILPSQV